jgi:hypothetical protein
MGDNSTLSGMCCFPWKCSIYRRIEQYGSADEHGCTANDVNVKSTTEHVTANVISANEHVTANASSTNEHDESANVNSTNDQHGPTSEYDESTNEFFNLG